MLPLFFCLQFALLWSLKSQFIYHLRLFFGWLREIMTCRKCEHRVLFKINICGVISWSTLAWLFNLKQPDWPRVKTLHEGYFCGFFDLCWFWQHFNKRPLYVYQLWRELSSTAQNLEITFTFGSQPDTGENVNVSRHLFIYSFIRKHCGSMVRPSQPPITTHLI